MDWVARALNLFFLILCCQFVRLPRSSSPCYTLNAWTILLTVKCTAYCMLLHIIVIHYPHLPYTNLCPEIKDPENRPSLVTIAVEMTPSLRVDACKEWCPAVQERMCLSCNPLPPPPLTSLKLALHSKWLLPLLMKWNGSLQLHNGLSLFPPTFSQGWENETIGDTHVYSLHSGKVN